MSRYADYVARVAADGGVITDAADCQAVFEAIEAATDFSGLALGISPRWGVKLSGSNITKFYNIADNDLDGTTVGTIARNTSGDYAVAEFGTGALGFGVASIAFANIPTNPTGMGQGCLWKDETVTPTVAQGALLKWTDDVVTYYAGSGAAYLRHPKDVRAGPEFGPASGQTAGVWTYPNIGGGVVFIQGLPLKSAFGTIPQTIDATFDMTIETIGVVNPELTDVLFFNDIEYDEFAAIAAFHAERYPAPVLPTIYWMRSDTQPTDEQVTAATDGFPAADGTKLAWYSTTNTVGSVWTAAVESFEAMPVTIGTHANLTITGPTSRIVEKTGGTDSAYDSIVYTAERAQGGFRVRIKLLALNKLGRVGDEFFASPDVGWDAASTLIASGFVGSGGGFGPGNLNDIADLVISFDGNTGTLYKNGTQLATGAENSSLTAAHDTRLGFFFWNIGAKIEVMGWGPHGANAHIKVAETSADGSTWGVPTTGHQYLRVSNDAGITTPSVEIG